jgi:hypothetical protein
MLDLDSLIAPVRRRRGCKQRRGALWDAGQPRSIGCGVRQLGAASLVNCQQSPTFERTRRDVEGASLPGTCSRLLERRGNGIVRSRGCEREVPGAPIGLRIGKRLGERAVCPSSLIRRGVTVDR